jgi:NADP-reducing hydrogenase subunit HndB
MAKVKTLDDLRKMKEELKNKITLREKGDNPESIVQIKVSMATCGIASGAKEIMDYFIEELDSQSVDAVITQTGCMGYCYAEPTIEVTLPGKSPLVFGYVNIIRAAEIINKYIKKGELVDGIIPDSYNTMDSK